MRLADHEDLYNIDAAKRMRVSRQTFDRILRRAHRKIAEALVLGQALRVLRPSTLTTREGSAPGERN